MYCDKNPVGECFAQLHNLRAAAHRGKYLQQACCVNLLYVQLSTATGRSAQLVYVNLAGVHVHNMKHMQGLGQR